MVIAGQAYYNKTWGKVVAQSRAITNWSHWSQLGEVWWCKRIGASDRLVTIMAIDSVELLPLIDPNDILKELLCLK